MLYAAATTQFEEGVGRCFLHGRWGWGRDVWHLPFLTMPGCWLDPVLWGDKVCMPPLCLRGWPAVGHHESGRAFARRIGDAIPNHVRHIPPATVLFSPGGEQVMERTRAAEIKTLQKGLKRRIDTWGKGLSTLSFLLLILACKCSTQSSHVTTS